MLTWAAATGLTSLTWSGIDLARAAAIGAADNDGLLAADVNGWRLLPGFTSRVIATTNQTVASTGLLWIKDPDGAAVIPKPGGGWYYIENSERALFDGGAAAIEFNDSAAAVGARRLLGTSNMNCSGCATPWGTYLSCEEHPFGAVWELDPTGARAPAMRLAMGRFQHEGAAVDADRRVIYLSEDRPDGGLYRFKPTVWGDLSTGELEILVETNGALSWAHVDPTGAPTFTHQQHPSTKRFNGGEGIAYWRGRVALTTRGDNRVWSLDPATLALDVFYDSATNANPQYTGVDQIVVAPWGDLICAEDGGDMQVIALDQSGVVTVVAQLTGVPGSELTGLAFDPSGKRLYVTSQRNPGRLYEIAGPFPEPAPIPPPPSAARFIPILPTRILDTRNGVGASGPPGAGQSVSVRVRGVAGVTDDAIAAIMNVTATEASAPGFVTAWAAGTQRPEASNLNVERAGHTVANLVTVPIGAGGHVALFSQSGTHLVADLAGYYVPVPTTAAGRYRPLAPTRLLDTRDGTGAAQAGAVPNDGEIVLQISGRAGMPATGIAAVALNVTSTATTGPGYITVWPDGLRRPLASNLNAERAGQTIANQVVVQVATNGRIRLYTQTATHLVVDVAGWITDASRPVNDLGRFVVAHPTRVLDTRTGAGAPARIVPPGGIVVLDIANRHGLPASGVAAVALNVTITAATGPGFVTVWPSDVARPLASNLNVVSPDQTVANHVIVAVSPTGQVALYTQGGGHLVADLLGWYTG